MIKIIGVIAIIATTSIFGFLLGESLIRRVKELKDLESAFVLLKNEILYTHSPLPEALLNVAKKSKDNCKNFFSHIANNLSENKVDSVMDAFSGGIGAYFAFINDYDKEIIMDFSKSLGTLDRESQNKVFDLLQIRLSDSIKEAEEKAKKNSKVYKTLGFSVGVVISIILI